MFLKWKVIHRSFPPGPSFNHNKNHEEEKLPILRAENKFNASIKLGFLCFWLYGLWIAQTNTEKWNDNLIEQGIQFLICFCVFLSTCYTLYYLIISYRAGRIYKSGRISTIVGFWWAFCASEVERASDGNKNAATIYFYNCQIACAIVFFFACCSLLNAFLTLRRGYHVLLLLFSPFTGK